MRDREVAYERNVSALEVKWADRIASFASAAVERLYDDGDYTDDSHGFLLDACETVTARLLNSTHWEAVEAADVSDIAYEAVQRAMDERGIY